MAHCVDSRTAPNGCRLSDQTKRASDNQCLGCESFRSEKTGLW